MKQFAYAFLIGLGAVLLTQCKTVNQPVYEIYRIDSVSNFYLIYAKMDTMRYEIVSEKVPSQTCEPIVIGKSYPLILHSKWEQFTNSQQPLEDSLIIQPNQEEGFYDLYHASNLKGLCLCDK